MCRSIKTLYNFDPPATHEEIRAAALQFVRKLSGFSVPSAVNEEVFTKAVNQITTDTQVFLDSLKTQAKPRDRAVEKEKAGARAIKRFGK